MGKDMFFEISGPEISALEEAQERTFKVVVDKSGERWFVATSKNAGDYIYYENKKSKDGFAGRPVTFTLEDGNKETVVGPWHSDSFALYTATGYDCRDKHLTRGIVARGRENVNGKTKYLGILYHDKEYTIGTFDRVKRIGLFFANKFKQRVFYGVRTMGGGTLGYCDHEKKAEAQQNE